MQKIKVVLCGLGFFVFAFAFVVSGQQGNQGKIDEEMQKKINEAIDKGAKYLLPFAKEPRTNPASDELILLTLIHAGVSKDDDNFKASLDRMLKSKLAGTYKVALQAMALEALDKRLYQKRIAQCGQFLIDGQCQNGQWSYRGSAIDAPAETPGKDVVTPGKDKNTQTGVSDKNVAGGKTDVDALPPLKPIKLKRRNMGGSSGDNSNSQYALLGLRACVESGVEIPQDVWQLAEKWWEQTQNVDGGGQTQGAYSGWGYNPNMPVSSSDKTIVKSDSYGSMTAGAVGSLAICKYYLKRKDWKKDKHILGGVDWLGKNFSVEQNPNIPNQSFFYYYLYALERAGILADTEMMGSHPWYYDGAKWLIEHQASDGSWVRSTAGTDTNNEEWGAAVEDTCWAILFLKRATKKLVPPTTKDVETGGSRGKSEAGSESSPKK